MVAFRGWKPHPQFNRVAWQFIDGKGARLVLEGSDRAYDPIPIACKWVRSIQVQVQASEILT